jgi:hypothetical protein
VFLSAKGANAGMVILNFSCKKLRDRDIMSKSDPQILLYTSVKDRANYTLVSYQLLDVTILDQTVAV